MRANIWSRRPVSSPTASRCDASGGNTPALRTGAAKPSPRFTPSATPARAPEMVLLFKVAAAMPMDCTSGTVFATSVAMARAKQDVSEHRNLEPRPVPPDPALRRARIDAPDNQGGAQRRGAHPPVGLEDLAG